ncbi:hypothetical protein BD289DRAFT_365306 [Coniella lustricola]|uniref:Cytochrome c oxidase assembly protein COX19 n=1 Tax=Coniella lustricola TaxID=2025994 RepID=A0A2T3ACJ4_9PEZI|nr:hypothetical protein BD289DRAFT_365306 [Coniella lustricola]
MQPLTTPHTNFASSQLIQSSSSRPQRGSFPLDHDGECKHVMSVYLACLKKVKGVNDNACRELAKDYLACRMDRNLMARDDFKNLGFQAPGQPTQKAATGAGVGAGAGGGSSPAKSA